MMKAITSCTAFLEWKHISGQRYELVAGNDLFAVINCESPYDLSAAAMTFDASWDFHCIHLLDSRFTVHSSQEREEIAFFTPVRSGQGVLQYTNGKAYTLRIPHANEKLRECQRVWSWIDENERELVTFVPRSGSWYNDYRRESQVVVTPAAQEVTELPLLAVLGWYIILLHHEDEEAVLAQVLMTIATANLYS